MLDDLKTNKYTKAWVSMCDCGLEVDVSPDELRYPEFDRPYGWRLQVPEEIRKVWNRLSPKQQYMACYIAEKELNRVSIVSDIEEDDG